MLLLLMPEQISPYWEDIKEGIEKTLPPGVPDRSQRILTGLLSGSVQAWISYHREDDKTIVDGAVLTRIIEDDIDGTRDLLIYCLWATDKTHESTWTEGLKALLDFGRGKGCNRAIAYSDVPVIIGLTKLMNGEALYMFLTWPI